LGDFEGVCFICDCSVCTAKAEIGVSPADFAFGVRLTIGVNGFRADPTAGLLAEADLLLLGVFFIAEVGVDADLTGVVAGLRVPGLAGVVILPDLTFCCAFGVLSRPCLSGVGDL